MQILGNRHAFRSVKQLQGVSGIAASPSAHLQQMRKPQNVSRAALMGGPVNVAALGQQPTKIVEQNSRRTSLMLTNPNGNDVHIVSESDPFNIMAIVPANNGWLAFDVADDPSFELWAVNSVAAVVQIYVMEFTPERRQNNA